MGMGCTIGSRFRLATAFTWCLLIASTTAARFEVRNEITKYPGRDRRLSFRCWSSNNQLGNQDLKPGESKSWSFTPVYIKIPFLYTYFQCTFFTAFGSPYGQTLPVFAGERKFRWQCDNPEEEECIWVVKREGVFLRKITRDNHGQRLYEDELKLSWIGGTNYHPVQEEDT
ncbi:hypothetical protein EUTSA_v10015656mg [Eutrema salsugineum]|uniref:Uncharacterized protein n=1 Tax=Eutrema salsugineum TaxID=72664 RepID=V4LBU4_EUTSA|nr:S-protein homolog 13 [Eutrema salsugineum]ESQ41149.1 hypothetical protein EUTSA_v10015656mg [Eutrema salsugineum]